MKTLSDIRRVKNRVEADLLKRPGVTGVDVGHKHIGGKKTDVLAIRIYVEKKKDVPHEDEMPRQIGGIPTDVIERRFILQSGQSDATDNEGLA